MNDFYNDNFYSFMDNLKNIIIFKKMFLSNDKEKILSNVLSDVLNVSKKFLLNNLEVYDIKDKITNLNYYKESNKIVCYVGNLEFIIRMHKRTKEKLFYEKYTYFDKNLDVEERDMVTFIIKVDS